MIPIASFVAAAQFSSWSGQEVWGNRVLVCDLVSKTVEKWVIVACMYLNGGKNTHGMHEGFLDQVAGFGTWLWIFGIGYGCKHVDHRLGISSLPLLGIVAFCTKMYENKLPQYA